jgi:hypothetical protein
LWHLCFGNWKMLHYTRFFKRVLIVYNIWGNSSFKRKYLSHSLVSHINGRTQIEVVWEQNAEKIFGPKREKVTEDGTKLHNEKICHLYSSPYIIRMVKWRSKRWLGHISCSTAPWPVHVCLQLLRHLNIRWLFIILNRFFRIPPWCVIHLICDLQLVQHTRGQIPALTYYCILHNSCPLSWLMYFKYSYIV